MPPAWFEVQKQNASVGFQKEQNAARDLIQKNLTEERKYTRGDFETLLDDHLLIALVNAKKLAQIEGNEGHFVVVYAQNDANFVLHDPGLPPYRGWVVDKDQFMQSFTDEIIAVPKGSMQFGIEVGRNDSCPCGSDKKYKKCHGA